MSSEGYAMHSTVEPAQDEWNFLFRVIREIRGC
jgi:hypothetical protein